jgi:hypothetical protein
LGCGRLARQQQRYKWSAAGSNLGLKPKQRLHHNVLAIALANKLARIAWAAA